MFWFFNPQEQYKTIFSALNEEFKAGVNAQTTFEFLEGVNDLTADTPANQTFIYTEFEVRKFIVYYMFTLKHGYSYKHFLTK